MTRIKARILNHINLYHRKLILHIMDYNKKSAVQKSNRLRVHSIPSSFAFVVAPCGMQPALQAYMSNFGCYKANKNGKTDGEICILDDAWALLLERLVLNNKAVPENAASAARQTPTGPDCPVLSKL